MPDRKVSPPLPTIPSTLSKTQHKRCASSLLYTFVVYDRQLLAAIDTLQWPGRVHLMGEGASGCIIALNAAILRPKFFKSLVLISPPSLVPSPDNKQLLTDLRCVATLCRHSVLLNDVQRCLFIE